jgi:hypothetical protein
MYYFYAALPDAKNVLQGKIAHWLKHSVGGTPKDVKRICGAFEYSSTSLDKTRCDAAWFERHPDEVFARAGFVIIKLPMEPDWIIHLYNQRGTAD